MGLGGDTQDSDKNVKRARPDPSLHVGSCGTGDSGTIHSSGNTLVSICPVPLASTVPHITTGSMWTDYAFDIDSPVRSSPPTPVLNAVHVFDIRGHAGQRMDAPFMTAKHVVEKSEDGTAGIEVVCIPEEIPASEDLPAKEQVDRGCKAWLSVFSSFLLNFVSFGSLTSFGVYQEEYQLVEFPASSATLISLIGSINVGVTLFVGAFMGRPCQLYGFRAVAATGAVIYFASTVAAGFCTTVPMILLCQGVVQGLGAGVQFVPGMTIPAQWFDQRRSLAMGIGMSGSSMGGVFWSLVARVLLSQLGRKWALVITAFINLFLCAVAVACLNERVKMPTPEEKREPILAWRMFADPLFAVLYLSSAISVFGYLAPFFYLPTWAITRTSNTTPFLASLLASMANLGSGLGRIVLGALADTRCGRMNTVMGAMFLAGVAQWVLWSVANLRESWALGMLFAIMYGFFGGGYIGVFPAVLPHVFDQTRLAALTGTFFTSELYGQTAGGPIAGAILDRFGGTNYYPMIFFSGAALVTGSLLGCVARMMADRRRWQITCSELCDL